MVKLNRGIVYSYLSRYLNKLLYHFIHICITVIHACIIPIALSMWCVLHNKSQNPDTKIGIKSPKIDAYVCSKISILTSIFFDPDLRLVCQIRLNLGFFCDLEPKRLFSRLAG